MLTRRKAHVLEDEWKLVLKSLLGDSNRFLQYIDEWEREFARYLGVKYAVAVNSGRGGMENILKSFHLEPGDEIIIPAYTLKDLISVIRTMRLVPIPADINPNTFNIDPDSVVKRITKKTKLILATHMFGTPCDIDEILKIAKNKSIYVIEDCAHSAGSRFKDKITGSFGDAAFYSFESMKPINTYGGGMVVTNNEDLFLRVRKYSGEYKYRSFLPKEKIFVAFLERFIFSTSISLPILSLLSCEWSNKKISNLYRLIQRPPSCMTSYTDFQASIGLKKIKTLDERIAIRQEKAGLFKQLLKGILMFQEIGKDVFPNYYFFVGLVSKNNIWRLRKRLLRYGIDAGIEAEITDDCGDLLGWDDCPNTKKVFKSAIQLPLHEGISIKHIYMMARVIKKIL